MECYFVAARSRRYAHGDRPSLKDSDVGVKRLCLERDNRRTNLTAALGAVDPDLSTLR